MGYKYKQFDSQFEIPSRVGQRQHPVYCPVFGLTFLCPFIPYSVVRIDTTSFKIHGNHYMKSVAHLTHGVSNILVIIIILREGFRNVSRFLII